MSGNATYQALATRIAICRYTSICYTPTWKIHRRNHRGQSRSMTVPFFVTPCWTSLWATRWDTVCFSLTAKKLAKCRVSQFAKTRGRGYSRCITATRIGTCSGLLPITSPLTLRRIEQSAYIPAHRHVGSMQVHMSGNATYQELATCRRQIESEDNFRVADNPGVGQTTQYKHVYRDLGSFLRINWVVSALTWHTRAT